MDEQAAALSSAGLAAASLRLPRCAVMPSTIIRSFDYRADARQLEILFTTGRRYLYSEVPPEAADALRAAFAKGRHFNARIRGRYPYVECDAAPAS